ncbi:hypothetical protein MACJ_002566 [Theileria orientalis]|uniref:Uncharacterized protein n=1 Tax=Theileria orientalis TaxID=68886 RepID=A0A976M6D0_THEOR|nr:hypothetical protein MACJ_002566 [Theileria orientalis]
MSESSHGAKNTICKLIAAFIALSSHLIMHQIDVTSSHFSVAFNIPINNISIYFSKLFSFRCMLIAAGTALELVVSELSKIIDPGGYYVYVILSIEALFFGYFHASVIGLVPEHSLAVAFAANVSRFFILFIQMILDAFIGKTPLLMIKIQVWIGVLMTGGAVVAWIYFNFGLCYIISAEDLEYLEECANASTKSDKKTSIIIQSPNVWEYMFSNKVTKLLIKKLPIKPSQDCIEIPSGTNVEVVVEEKGFGITFYRALSPFLMFFGGSMFKDFLFPGVLPYALVRRDRCHTINMLVPVANILGPIVLFVDESRLFPKWTPYFDGFWSLLILMIMVAVSAFMTIHSRAAIFRGFINSPVKVAYLTLTLVFCNGFMDPLSFAGVAKMVKKGFESETKEENIKLLEKFPQNGGSRDNNSQTTSSEENKSKVKKFEGNNSLLTVHVLSALFMRFVFSKSSVGYNDTRVSLGYCLPKFRPNHKMSKHNTRWYIFRQTFIRAWKDTGSDFKLDVKKYL